MLSETFQEVVPMICVSELTKTYGRTVAVDNISFEIPSGQIVGYLGPNGAGKSTTVKMLVGILKPAHGHVAVAGCDSQTDTIELKRHIGYVPEDAVLYETLTPVEYLRLVGQLYHITENSIDEKTSEFFELFNLTEVSHQRISSLSKGPRPRCLLTVVTCDFGATELLSPTAADFNAPYRGRGFGPYCHIKMDLSPAV